MKESGGTDTFVAEEEKRLRCVVSAGFGGCIRNVRKKLVAGPQEEQVDLVRGAEQLRNVHMDGCPAQAPADLACGANNVQRIYAGPDNSTFDHGLEPFTRESWL